MAIVAPVVVAAVLAAHGRNVPYQDEWVFARLVVKDVTGTLTLADLWARHIDHRVLVPQALWIVFSLAQRENWLWGWQLTVFLVTLCAVVAAWSLHRFGSYGPGPLVAMAAAVVATLSFGSGQILLALVPLALLVAPGRLPGRIAAAGAAAALGNWLAQTAWLPPIGTRPRVDPWTAPAVIVEFALACLGAPLAGDGVTRATAAGVVGITVLVVAGAWLWWTTPSARRALVPWLFLAAYGGANAGAVGYARALTWIGRPLTSRYVGLTWPFWVAFTMVAGMALARLRERRDARARVARATMCLLLAVAGVGLFDGWRVG